MKKLIENPGFVKGKKALKVTYCSNPQLGNYVVMDIVFVKKITSASAIIEKWGEEEKYSFKNYTLIKKPNPSLYGELRKELYPVSMALDLLKREVKGNSFLGYRISAPLVKEYIDNLVFQLSLNF